MARELGQHQGPTPFWCRWFNLHKWSWTGKLTRLQEECQYCCKVRDIKPDND